MPPFDFLTKAQVLPEVPDQWILCCDLDAFYASVEQKLDPTLHGQPVIVGPNPHKGAKRGVVLTCSYEARKYGVRSAMPILRAAQLCPHAEYRFTGFDEYKKASRGVMAILAEYDQDLRVTSIDEAFLDVSEQAWSSEEVKWLAQTIQQRVWEEEGLGISVGASHTSTIAKVASSMDKPKGVTVIPKERFREFLDPLPLKVIPGVGKKSYAALVGQGFDTIGSLAKLDYGTVPTHLQSLWRRTHGISTGHTPKSHGRSHSREQTFGEDEGSPERLVEVISKLTERLLGDLGDQQFRTFSIKVRDQSFNTFSRSRSFPSPLPANNQRTLGLCLVTANELLEEFLSGEKRFRLLGVKASNFAAGQHTQRRLTEFL